MAKAIAVPGTEVGKLKQTRAQGTMSTTKQNWLGALVGLAIICAGVIVCMQAQKTPVERMGAPGKPTPDYETLIQMHMDRASQRNIAALKIFDMEINRVVAGHKGRMAIAAGEAAKEASTYGSCCKLIYYLTVDKAMGKNEAGKYLNQQISPFINPAMENMGRDVDAAIKQLDYALRRSTVALASELAGLGPGNERPYPAVDLDQMNHIDIHQALRNLGFDAAGIAVSMAFDAVAISKSKIAAILLTRVVSTGGRVFGRQIAVATASVVAAAADGPLPIGDILGGIGILWTGYDIYASRDEFETEIHTALDNLVAETIDGVHKQSLDYARALVEKCQQLQSDIASQTLNHTAKGGN